jgi:anti-sigma factor RsiW
MAALLDADLTAAERIAAQSRIAACRACAALYADLLALSTATAALPAPARPRDFRLDAADAARLTGTTARLAPTTTRPVAEPVAATARLAGVMTDPRTTGAHASHDTILVASLADHSLPASERAAAEALIANCRSCATLHDELMALRAATRAMPTPPRPRDFTLTPEDAIRLRPGGWRRFVAILGSSRDALSRPLAAGLTTIGLAGLLVAAIPSVIPGSAASAPRSAVPAVGAPVTGAAQGAAQGDAAASGPPTDVSAEAAGPIPSPNAFSPGGVPVKGVGAAASPGVAGAPAITDQNGYGAPTGPGSPPPADSLTSGARNDAGPTQAPLDVTAAPATDAALAGRASGISWLAVLSTAFLIAGLSLFALRWTARRLVRD